MRIPLNRASAPAIAQVPPQSRRKGVGGKVHAFLGKGIHRDSPGISLAAARLPGSQARSFVQRSGFFCCSLDRSRSKVERLKQALGRRCRDDQAKSHKFIEKYIWISFEFAKL